VASIRRCCRAEGRRLYPTTREVLIAADDRGSNEVRPRLWKWELQKFADGTGLSLFVCHSPGTSRWNKIERRLSSFISSHSREGEPLRACETIMNLIVRTPTAKGLTVICHLDRRKYPTDRKVSDQAMMRVNAHGHTFVAIVITLSNRSNVRLS
jgi:Rhodopirellula transposase DDE domain